MFVHLSNTGSSVCQPNTYSNILQVQACWYIESKSLMFVPVQGSPQHTGATSTLSSPESTSDGATLDVPSPCENTQAVGMCIVIGGMDTEGEIFDDSLVMLLDES